jgi:hypothetical protein
MIIQLILLMLPQKQRPPNSFHTASASRLLSRQYTKDQII